MRSSTEPVGFLVIAAVDCALFLSGFHIYKEKRASSCVWTYLVYCLGDRPFVFSLESSQLKREQLSCKSAGAVCFPNGLFEPRVRCAEEALLRMRAEGGLWGGRSSGLFSCTELKPRLNVEAHVPPKRESTLPAEVIEEPTNPEILASICWPWHFLSQDVDFNNTAGRVGAEGLLKRKVVTFESELFSQLPGLLHRGAQVSHSVSTHWVSGTCSYNVT